MSDTQQGDDWWQASDGKWYPPTSRSADEGLPAPPAQVVIVEKSGNGMAVAALTLGIIGTVFGLIPILFVIAFVCGILALVFGLVGRKKGKPRRTMATIGAILGLVAFGLGILGVVIVNDVFEDLDEILDPDLNASPVSPADAIPEYGNDPALDRLADRCAASGKGADNACADLWARAPAGSGYEAYGGDCGARPDRDGFTCNPVDE